jgi:hypothetical protein
VSFEVAVAQAGTLFAKSIQEGRLRSASKLLRVDAVPDSRICHYEIKPPLDVREMRAYSGSGNSGKIVIEVVKGDGRCSCAFTEGRDLS